MLLSFLEIVTDHLDEVVPQPERFMLAAERLLLREVTPAVAKCIVANDHRHFDWTAEYPLEGTIPPAEAVLSAGEEGRWQPRFGMFQIVLRGSATVIGDVGFIDTPEGGRVEIGYGIASSYQGQGFTTEAAIALTNWALTQPEIDEVWAATEEDHTASQGVLVRAGFELVDRNDGMRRYRRSADVAE
jgi:RimJ/RimL family protein N-acetyltransferase